MTCLRKLTGYLLCAILTLTLTLLSACGGGGGGSTGGSGGDVTAPILTSTSPVADATNVSPNSVITLTWNEPVVCSTIAANVGVSPASGLSFPACTGNTNSVTISTSGQSFSTPYTMTIGNGITDLAGNHYAGSSFSYTTGANPDSTAPTLLPSSGPANLTPDSNVILSFSEPILCSTVTTSSVTISPAPAVSWTRSSCSGSTAVFTPSGQSYSTGYTVNIGTTVTDPALNHFAGDSISYTTGSQPDTTPPSLQSTNPAGGSSGITINSPVTLNWNENIDCTTVNTSNVTLTPATAGWTLASCSGTTAIFQPSGQNYETAYTVTIGTGVKDLAGNSSNGNNFAYTTEAAPVIDTTAPMLASSAPANGATGVILNSIITLNFNEPVDCTTVDATSVTISGGSLTFDSCSGSQALFTTDSQNFNTTYTVTVSADNSILDLAGTPNAMLEDSFSFTTGPDLSDTTSPTVTAINPTAGATGVPLDGEVTITWDEAVDCTTVNDTTVTITPAVGWTRTFCSADTARFQTSGQIYSTDYVINVTTAVKDPATNRSNSFSSNYRTAPAAYPTATTVDNYENDNSLATASTFTIGDLPQARTIFPETDQDWIAVDLIGNQSYEFSVNHLNAVGDSYLQLFRANGTEVTDNSDGPVDFADPLTDYRDDYSPIEHNLLIKHSRIRFTPNSSATYYLKVTTWEQTFGSGLGLMTYVFSAHTYVNGDGDLFSSYYDCNDGNPSISPEAPDIPADGIDQNCSGVDQLVDTIADPNEVDSFTLAANMVPRSNSVENNFLHEIYVNNSRTIDNTLDYDYFTVAVPPQGAIFLDFLFDTLGGDLTAELYEPTNNVEGSPDVTIPGPSLQDYLLENLDPTTTKVYKLRFSRSVPGNGGGGYYVPTYVDIGVDMDGDGFYTHDYDYLRDCDDTVFSNTNTCP